MAIVALEYPALMGDVAGEFSGDATPSDAIVDACNGCDVLLHEVYSKVKWDGRAPIWQRYHADAHTSTIELAGLAARARPGVLELRAKVVEVKGRKVKVAISLFAKGDECARGEVVAVQMAEDWGK